ncbi:hypothetical protein ACTD5D_21305 [Nocardia takedensis]|uniref:hypothetical protein n=1 Tax=Nocardia takedensis TaxID=259390 RepID=UPI003F76CF9C
MTRTAARSPSCGAGPRFWSTHPTPAPGFLEHHLACDEPVHTAALHADPQHLPLLIGFDFE